MFSKNLIWGNFYSFFESFYNNDASSNIMLVSLGSLIISYLSRFVFFVLVPTFKFTSVFGFSLLINMLTQIWSGILLSLYYIPDPALVIVNSEELMNEVWWFFYVYKIHVVGVDSIFVLSYLHILNNIFINNFLGGEVDGWTSGTYAFLVYHVVVFLGITLSTNHLGDLTLTIGSNIFWSLFGYKHNIYTIFFTNKHLNMEQLSSLMIAHYVSAWYYVYLVQTHVMFIHEMWDSNSGPSANQDNTTSKANWFIDGIAKESSFMFVLFVSSMSYNLLSNLPDLKPVNFMFFEQWSESEFEEINYFIVGPHWYFSPHMGLLTICAQHYEGLFWLIAYYVILSNLPTISIFFGVKEYSSNINTESSNMTSSVLQYVGYVFFLMSILYVGGTLPCGSFYYEVEEGYFGNMFLSISYQYIYIYLIFLIHLLDVCDMFIVNHFKDNNENNNSY